MSNIRVDANSVDPDQIGAVWSGSTLFVKEASKCFSRQQEHTTFFICALMVNTCEVSVYTVRTFMKCMHVYAAQKAY